MTDFIKLALELATLAHEGQVRKNSGIPYVNHPIQVMEKFEELVVPYLKQSGYSETEIDQMKCACLLHDVLEDTKYTRDDIMCHMGSYGMKVTNHVIGLTDTSKNLYPFAKREERKTIDAVRMHGESEEVQMIKMCDIICNCTDYANEDPGYAVKYITEKQAYVKFMTKLPTKLKIVLDSTLSTLYTQAFNNH